MKILLTGFPQTEWLEKIMPNHSQAPKRHELVKPTEAELNLLNPLNVQSYVGSKNPDIIIHAAGIVGGIQANIDRPVKFTLMKMFKWE